MYQNLYKFLALDKNKQVQFMLASMYLLALKLALRLFGLSRCYRGLARLATKRHTANKPTEWESYTNLAIIIRQAGHSVAAANCLPQSLLLWCWLCRQGMDASLQIGVDRQTADLAAHAWVEVEGQAVAEANNITTRFAPFEQLVPTLEQVSLS